MDPRGPTAILGCPCPTLWGSPSPGGTPLRAPPCPHCRAQCPFPPPGGALPPLAVLDWDGVTCSPVRRSRPLPPGPASPFRLAQPGVHRQETSRLAEAGWRGRKRRAEEAEMRSEIPDVSGAAGPGVAAAESMAAVAVVRGVGMLGWGGGRWAGAEPRGDLGRGVGHRVVYCEGSPRWYVGPCGGGCGDFQHLWRRWGPTGERGAPGGVGVPWRCGAPIGNGTAKESSGHEWGA